MSETILILNALVRDFLFFVVIPFGAGLLVFGLIAMWHDLRR